MIRIIAELVGSGLAVGLISYSSIWFYEKRKRLMVEEIKWEQEIDEKFPKIK